MAMGPQWMATDGMGSAKTTSVAGSTSGRTSNSPNGIMLTAPHPLPPHSSGAGRASPAEEAAHQVCVGGGASQSRLVSRIRCRWVMDAEEVVSGCAEVVGEVKRRSWRQAGSCILPDASVRQTLTCADNTGREPAVRVVHGRRVGT